MSKSSFCQTDFTLKSLTKMHRNHWTMNIQLVWQNFVKSAIFIAACFSRHKWNCCNLLLNIWTTVGIMSTQLALYMSVLLWFSIGLCLQLLISRTTIVWIRHVLSKAEGFAMFLQSTVKIFFSTTAAWPYIVCINELMMKNVSCKQIFKFRNRCALPINF